MTDPQKEAREIAARHGVKAYEPPVDTGKQEPGCECRVRKALDRLMDFCRSLITMEAVETPKALLNELEVAALADPCSCEQLRSDAEVVRMAESFQERALKAELALIAARSLLEEARQVLDEIRCVKLTDTRRRLAVLAKIEASRTPEVKP